MATTPNYSFSVYSSTDTDVRFLDFRVATAGSQSTSNFYVIDTVLKQHSDAIDSINATPSAFVVKGTYSSGSLYTASVANYPGYKNEQLIVLSLNQKNTGAVQININGTTNKDVMKYGSDGVLKAVDAGDFVANSPVLCLYDGTRFVVIGITSASSITVTGKAGDILQIADDGTIESSGKKAAQPNGIATLDENGNVVQVANMANSAAAVYSGAPVSIAYAGAQRIASITAYGENAQGGTTEAPVALTGVDSVHVCGRNLLQRPYSQVSETKNGLNVAVNADGTITVSGTATAETYLNLKPIPASLYRLIGETGIVQSYDHPVTKNGFTFFDLTIQPHADFALVYIVITKGSVVNRTYCPYIIKSAEPLPYEPYQGSVTPLPIPRQLHKVGDVRDICCTRVKSVYDKRIVIDQNSIINMSGEASIVGTSRRFNVPAEDIPITNDAVIEPVRCNILPARPSGGVSGTYALDAPGISLQNNQSVSQPNINIRVPGCKTLEEIKAWLTDNPLTVYYQSTSYNGANGLDICLTEYQNGSIELDGTESNLQFFSEYQTLAIKGITTAGDPSQANAYGVCISSHFALVPPGTSTTLDKVVYGQPQYNQIIIHDTSWNSLETAKAYLAAQKAAGTPVQIAYQLATPEVYATDPVDFDNTAGPLTVVTGGQAEVKMTDFVTDRTPAFLNKLDKTGDGSDVTVTFTEAATDTDIASGDKLSILFGKILKRFTNILNGTTKVGYATKADTDNLGNQITGTYANSLGVANNTIVLKNKIGENLSTITVPYANSAGNVATSIKEMGIAVQTASPYAWFLNYTGSGNKDGARKYYASVYADNATYSTSAGSSNNIVIYNNNWSGTDGSIKAIYANAEKTYVDLSASNAAVTARPNISVQRINGHVLNMALNGTSLSITW